MNPGKHIDSSQTTLTLAQTDGHEMVQCCASHNRLHVPIGKYTSYITQATQMLPTIYDFSYKMAHLVTMDPNLEDRKPAFKNWYEECTQVLEMQE